MRHCPGWRLVHGAGVAVALLLVAAAALSAQVAEIRIRTEATGEPVIGAIVRLLENGTTVARALSSESGRLVLAAPRPGSFLIRVDRIGYEGTLVGPFVLAAADTLRTVVTVPSRRMDLPTLVVEGTSSCGSDFAAGSLAAALWSEVGKALLATTLTEESAAIPFHVKEFYRDVDREGRLLREWTVGSSIVRGPPFATVPPAELAELGFVRALGDGTVFDGPDAALLVSDEFVSTHCFRAVPGPDLLVGLAFEPIKGRSVVDIRGTLWVNRATSELLRLEYRYTGLPRALRDADLGGRIEFQRLPAGHWIVGLWYVRMPRGSGAAGKASTLIGYRDQGGRATIATEGTGPLTHAILLGRVVDSTTGEGLPGVSVAVSTGDSAVTDAEGRYRLALTAAGPSAVTADHPKLLATGAIRADSAVLSIGDTTVVSFGVPSLETLTVRSCRTRGASGTVHIVGRVAPGPGIDPAGIRLTAAWPTGPDVSRMRVRSEKHGLFRFCGVPGGKSVLIEQHDGNRTVATKSLITESGRSSWVDLPDGAR